MSPIMISLRTTMVIKIFLLSLSISFFNSHCSASVPSTVTEQHNIHGDEKFLWLPWLHHPIKIDVVVAQDGWGKYKSIQEAIDAVPKNRRKGHSRFVIHVKAGIYEETILIGRHLHNLTLVGDGIGKTIITSDRAPRHLLQKKSATVQVDGHGFFAQGITFTNTAGPRKISVALRSSSDKGVFYQCSFEGHRNTLLVHSMRQFFRECEIYGTSDFIIGSATAVFQKCKIVARKGVSRRNSIILHRRLSPYAETGFSILDSTVIPAPDLVPFVHQYKTYLGEPAGKYSRTVIARTNLDGFIDPEGWYSKNDNFKNTVYYGEYKNSGPGVRTDGRVKWPGYHVMSRADASQFTVEQFLGGHSWLLATSVPFDLGL